MANGAGADRARNAALWYVGDGYDPAAHGINGRRVAGESFLRGFLSHAEIDEAVFVSASESQIAPVRTLAQGLRPGLRLRHVPQMRMERLAPIGTLYYPSPNFAARAWERAPHGGAAWSLCGVTHTISSEVIMTGWMALRTGPLAEWDAVICTSRSVYSAVTTQMDLIDAHLERQLSARMPPRPMLPVIPLGIDCAAFAHDAAARAALRAQLGAAEGDVVFATVARLNPYEKFDPIPVFAALAEAQRQLGEGQKLFWVLCGVAPGAYARNVFEEGARLLMPEGRVLVTDGSKPGTRVAALSAADVFLFPIDNIQESFGLAPVEGMAAGLPVLCSDWDGLRDTVTGDVGFRVTTRSLPPQHLTGEALRYHGGIDSFSQYSAAVSAMVEIDMAEMTARMVELARAPDLRRRMGAAARARAHALYDWSAVIPRMQDLWAEQDARRRAVGGPGPRLPRHALPIAPSPMTLFRDWPSALADMGAVRYAARPAAASLSEMLGARNYLGMHRMFDRPEAVAAALSAIEAAGTAGIGRDDLVRALRSQPVAVDRILMWLMKYGFLRRMD